MLQNVGVIRVEFTGEHEDDCPGLNQNRGPAFFDNVPMYSFEVLEGDPFLDDPFHRFIFIRDNISALSHLACRWLQSQGVEVRGLLPEDEVYIYPSATE